MEGMAFKSLDTAYFRGDLYPEAQRVVDQRPYDRRLWDFPEINLAAKSSDSPHSTVSQSTLLTRKSRTVFTFWIRAGIGYENYQSGHRSRTTH